MTNYSCEKCGKKFSQKRYYTKHLNKKISYVVECNVNKTLDNVDEKKSTEELTRVVKREVIVEINDNNTIDIQNTDGMNYLKIIKNNSIDLILTDPPYIISRESGMNTHYNKVKDNEINKIETVKTDQEWEEYKTENNISNDNNKSNYVKYGTSIW